ncbi:MAG: glycosyltransferase family 4 protein [Candidatus Omnitrophica bacterium]|nr:glycosyltransferase family 4 protein [Candidatus Omnitrophota bacterium]MCM8831989.1 glycosyltransferase family 4 protein [Candidatus Omnitrophota bacterium]
MQKNSNLKIAIDARELQKNILTGIARFLKNFLDNIEIDKNIFLCIDKNTSVNSYEEKFSILKASGILSFWYDQINLRNFLKKYKIDIFFSPYYKMPFFSSCKKIITIHDLYFLRPILRKGLNRFKPFIFYLKKAINLADKIITVSQYSKEEIIKTFDIEKEKVKVVYNCVGKIFKKVEQDRSKYIAKKYKIDKPYILYVGNFYPHKNIKGLLKAFLIFLKEFSKSYKLVIIAKKNKFFKDIYRYAKEIKVSDYVIFLDFVSDEELVYFYNFADIFVLPSFYEGFGLTALEAIACGNVVAVSNIGSLKEIFADAVVYFDPYNPKDIFEKMVMLIKDEKLKCTLKEKSINLIAKFSVENFSSKLLEEIKNV